MTKVAPERKVPFLPLWVVRLSTNRGYMGPFGGGWRWKLGIDGGSTSYVVYLVKIGFRVYTRSPEQRQAEREHFRQQIDAIVDRSGRSGSDCPF